MGKFYEHHGKVEEGQVPMDPLHMHLCMYLCEKMLK